MPKARLAKARADDYPDQRVVLDIRIAYSVS